MSNLVWGPIRTGQNPSRFPLHTTESGGVVSPPLLTGIPDRIVVGTTVILQGTGFTVGTRVVLTDGAGVTVTLPIALISSTQLSVTIPAYWQTGHSTLAVTDGTTTSYSLNVSVDPAAVPSPWLTGVMTPGRKSYAQFDLDETILVAPAFYKRRTGAEIARPSVQKASALENYHNMHFWDSLGGWTLKLKQSNIARLHEYDADNAAIIILSKLRALLYDAENPTTGLHEEYRFRAPSDLNGIADGGSLLQAAQADPFITKKVAPPPEVWSADIGSNYRYPSLDIPEDRIAESFDTYPVDQGYFLRWKCPGTGTHNPNRIWRFYFGQYAVSIDGDGFCRLYEQPAAPALPDGSVDWPLRHEWRYAEPSRVCGVDHTLAIWPSYDRKGNRYILFGNSALEAVGAALAVSNNAQHGETTAQTIYNADSGARGTDPDQSPGTVTREDLIRIDTRRDLRVTFQISLLDWETSGSLTDLPESMFTSISGFPTQIAIDGYIPVNGGITGTILDADHLGQPFIDGQSTNPYVTFQFTGDGRSTPILYSYALSRPQITNTISPGSFSSDVRSVRLDGFDGDPTTQTGQILISDPMAKLPRLRVRGSFSCRVATSYVPVEIPNAKPIDVTLHRGYTIRPDNEKHGKPWPQSAYPNPDWRDFMINLQGAWWRLKKRVELSPMRSYAFDYNAMPSDKGIYPPWKITDIITNLILLCGYPAEQINIPDNPIRLWTGKNGTPDELIIKPETNYSEVIIRLARNYLGAYVIYDENAGKAGQWRLYYASLPGDPPLIKFVTSKPNSYVPDHILPAYQDGSGIPVIPVLSDPLCGHIVEPEFNLVWVYAPYKVNTTKYERQLNNWKHNPKAFNVPGYPQTADPNHCDYSPIGCVPLIIGDATLAGDVSTDLGLQQSQAAVDFTVCRLYDFACHAQALTNFRAPFVCVWDSNINAYRRPRYQDPVTLDGIDYVIKSCSLDYNSDSIQLADYELLHPVYDAG